MPEKNAFWWNLCHAMLGEPATEYINVTLIAGEVA